MLKGAGDNILFQCSCMLHIDSEIRTADAKVFCFCVRSGLSFFLSYLLLLRQRKVPQDFFE
mgnify:CR=1 FL=1